MGQFFSREGRKLLNAISKDDTEAVRNIVAREPKAVLYTTFWRKRTPLILASKTGNILTISTLLWACEQALGEHYVDYINEVDATGNTAIHIAAKYGRITVLRILIEEGGSPLYANNRGVTALHLAAHRGHTTCVELLLDCPVTTATDGTPLAANAMVHDISGLTRYINATTNSGFAALHLASFARSTSCVAALVQKGATLDIPVVRGLERMPFMCGGSTPLHIAAAQGDARTCLVLLEGQWRHPGLELRRVRNMMGLTALNCALLGGHHDIVRVLIEAGRRGSFPSSSSSGSSAAAFRMSMNDMANNMNIAALNRNGLQTTFPESLRQHMLGVLRRAMLVVQLRKIAGNWKEQGLEKPSDVGIVNIPGIDSLTPSRIHRLVNLLESPNASLRDVLFGLEEVLRRRGGGSSSIDGDNSSDDDSSSHSSSSSSSSRAGSSNGDHGDATIDSNGATIDTAVATTMLGLESDSEEEGTGTPRSSTNSSSRSTNARSTDGTQQPSVIASDSTASAGDIITSRTPSSNNNSSSGGGGVSGSSASLPPLPSAAVTATTRNTNRGSVDWSMLRRAAELQYFAAHLVGGGGASAGQRAREQRRSRRQQQQQQHRHESGRERTRTSHYRRSRHDTAPAAPPALASSTSTSSNRSADDAEKKKKKKKRAGDIAAAAAADATNKYVDDDCAICMDSNAEISFLPCTHSVCFHCACQLCMKPSEMATCPFCRREVETVSALVGARRKQHMDGMSGSGSNARNSANAVAAAGGGVTNAIVA